MLQFVAFYFVDIYNGFTIKKQFAVAVANEQLRERTETLAKKLRNRETSERWSSLIER